MAGELNLDKLLATMEPHLHEGTYVFVQVKDISKIPRSATICEFAEEEGRSVIIEKKKADQMNLKYEYEAAWITLKVYSALEAVGFTAKIAKELAANDISCNVVAAYAHDHIFVSKKDGSKTLKILQSLREKAKG